MSLLSLCGELRDSAADRQGVGYSRDQAGQVVAVTGANRGGERVYAQKIRYRSSGLVKQVSYGNGRQLSVAYDNRLRVSRWEVSGVLGWEYEYDNFGERSGRATFARNLYDATLDRSWEYDQVGRLMHAYSGEEARAHVGRGAWGSPTGPYAHSYEYDVWGNMVRRVGWGGWNAAYEASYVGNRRVGFEYDGAGDVVDDGRQQYGYDAVWRQAWAQGSGYRLEQQYDGDGLRVKKNDNGEVVYYIRSSVLGGQVVAEIREWGGGWIWSRGYVYWPDGELMAVQQGGVRWVHRDAVVKSQRLTDEAGNVVAVVELDPWGGETDRSVNQRQQPYRYTTYERDGDGVDQALMRSYHRWWTRFNEPDPWEGSYDLTDPQSFNRYTYVRNDPVNYVDPSGLDRFCIIDVSCRHFEYINRDGDQTIRIETILHQTCFDVPTAPIGGREVSGGGGGAPAPEPPQTQQRPPSPQGRNRMLQALREKVKKECLERKKKEADKAKAEFLARYPDRVLRGMKLGAARGVVTGGYFGATGGFAVLGWGAIPGAVAGAFVGATVGAGGGAITSGFFIEPVRRQWYDYWVYRPALDLAEIECDIEADNAVYKAGGLL